MAGTLFGLPLSIQFDEAGRPASGGLLYTYDANTSTPANTYADFALGSVNTWPLQLDAAGRIPSFYVDDGSYRARLTTSGGVELFDEQSITAIGASAGGSSGGGGSVADEVVFQTGYFLWLPIAGTLSGFVRANGRTIGSGASGATERANADTQSLFEWFWNNFSNSFCAVSGGRGGSATADFNANKTLATLDMRSKIPMGLGDMGNSALGITGESTIAATAIGASTYTVAQANLPNINLSSTGLTATFSIDTRTRGDTGNQNTVLDDANGGSFTSTVPVQITGNIPLGGSGTDLDILPPSRVGTFYVKL